MKTVSFWLIACCLIFSACSTVKQTSSKLENNIVIDGNIEDWNSKSSYHENPGILTGFTNDSSDLFICISTSKREFISQILLSGLTIWFDADGGREKETGIRYPVVRIYDHRMSESTGQMQNIMNINYGEMLDKIKGKLKIIELIESDKNRKKIVDLMINKEFEAALNIIDGRLIIEMKTPLKGDKSGIIPSLVNNEGKIGVGLYSRDFKEMRQRGTSGSRDSPGGMGRGGMGSLGSTSRGGGFGNRSRMPDPLRLWIELTLNKTN